MVRGLKKADRAADFFFIWTFFCVVAPGQCPRIKRHPIRLRIGVTNFYYILVML